MQFEDKFYFTCLFGLPVLIIFFWWAEVLYKHKKSQFVEKAFQDDVAPDYSIGRYRFKNFLLALVFIISIITLARPQWGFELREVKRKGIDILIVIDTSRSMLTQDVRPNRLERTKLAVKDLIKQLKGDRVGLIAFSGDAFLVCPLTIDYSGFLLSLNDISTTTISRGGTNLEAAINEAMDNYEEGDDSLKSIIIVTDGDNLEGDPLGAAKKAAKDNIKVYTVGIGTKEGELIQITNRAGKKEFIKDDNGNFIKSRLNEKLLQEIAILTGGFYVKASGARFGLDTIYERELSKIEKQEFESKMDKKYYERFQIPLFLAFLLLLTETCLTTRKKIK